MQEVYAEIRGTLARTADKKNTTLYKLHRQRVRQDRAEKFGFAERPKYPSECTTVGGAKHFLNDIADEIGHKIARLSNSSLHSIERDGEKIRALNKEIYVLMRQKEKWAQRVQQLMAVEASNRGGRANDVQPSQPQSRERVPFAFFGCAKHLPEAIEEIERGAKREERLKRDQEAREQRRRKKQRLEPSNDDDDGAPDIADDDREEDATNPWALSNAAELDRNPVFASYIDKIEAMDAEFRVDSAAVLAETASGSDEGPHGFITDFSSVSGAGSVALADRLVPPRSPAEMKQLLFQRKKEALMRAVRGSR